jgi:hypothetical protein
MEEDKIILKVYEDLIEKISEKHEARHFDELSECAECLDAAIVLFWKMAYKKGEKDNALRQLAAKRMAAQPQQRPFREDRRTVGLDPRTGMVRR